VADYHNAEWIERAGYVFSKKLLHDIAARDMTDYVLRNKRQISVLVSKGLGMHNRMLSRWGTDTRAHIQLSEHEEAGFWSEGPNEVALLSSDIVGTVVAEMGVHA
jgi:hypothetical protein